MDSPQMRLKTEDGGSISVDLSPHQDSLMSDVINNNNSNHESVLSGASMACGKRKSPSICDDEDPDGDVLSPRKQIHLNNQNSHRDSDPFSIMDDDRADNDDLQSGDEEVSFMFVFSCRNLSKCVLVSCTFNL